MLLTKKGNRLPPCCPHALRGQSSIVAPVTPAPLDKPAISFDIFTRVLLKGFLKRQYSPRH